MMYCVHCGKEISDDVDFCPYCGQSTGTSDQATGGGTAQPNSSAVPQRSNVVTDIGKSKLMLVFVILVSAQVLFTVVTQGSVWGFLRWADLAFLCVGCWLIYANSSQESKGRTGFTILRIGIPIEMVLMAINTLVSIVNVARWSYGAWKAVYIIVSLIVVVLALWVYYKFFNLASDGLKILDGETVQWKVSTTVLVVFIIVVALLVFSDIQGLALYGYTYFLYGKLAFVFDIAANIVAVVMLFAINNRSEQTRG